MPVNANFVLPKGSADKFSEVEDLPELPKIGDFVQDSRPGSQVFRVESVTYLIDSEANRCCGVSVKLEAYGKTKS